MNIRRIGALILLAMGAVFFTSQTPSDLSAQDTKAEKKALRMKLREEKLKAEAEAAKAAEAAKTAEKPIVKMTPTETKPSNPLDVKKVAKLIDAEINKELAKAKIEPSSRSSDAEYLRRASLDITGVIPAPDKVESFQTNSDPDKRAKLIDELLSSSNYGRHLADIWGNQMYVVDSENRFVTKEPLVKYLTATFNGNKPWDRMAHEILTATGEQEKNGEVTYYMANRGVDKMTDTVGKLFLGVQIQCAQCHNHPFTHWKQAEYWGMAQFFYKVNAVVQRNAKTEVAGKVEEIAKPQRKINPLPESAKNVSAKFLGADAPKLDNAKPLRPVLADWICTAENPFFSKSMVNRVWAQFFGKGMVNPIDDLSDENTPSHPELLNGLAKEFASGGFDLKQLIRAICLTDAYQRTSVPAPGNKADTVLYSHMAVKVMTPEQLYDSIALVVGDPSAGGARPAGKTPRGAATSPRDRFAAFFMGSENAKATEYEAGIPQALRLMNNPKLSGSPNLLNTLSKAGDKPEKIIDRLFRMTISRQPNEAETKKLTDYIAKAPDAKTAYSDILWALMNSSEFTLNH